MNYRKSKSKFFQEESGLSLLKRLFSLILGIFMVTTGITNVSAIGGGGKKDVTALVVGDEASQKKFVKIMFGEEKRLGSFYFCANEPVIKCAVTMDYEKHKEKIEGYIKSNFVEGPSSEGSKMESGHFKVIIATVDVDQEVDKVKADMRKVVDYICDYKTVCTQILVVACSKSNSDMDFNKLANYTVDVERDCTDNGWGNKRNKCLDTSQFLSFCPLYESLQEDFKKFILELNEKYDYYKKKTQPQCLIVQINKGMA